MALPIVHLLVARGWAKDKPALADCPAYYLGAIAPDAIHVRYHDDKSRKNEFHLGNWLSPHPEQVYAYWAEHCSPFDIGYGVHVLTDASWVPRYKAAFPGLLRQDGKIDVGQYYNDVWRADFELLRRRPETGELLSLLRLAEAPEGHPYLTRAEFEAWRDIVLEAYEKPCPAANEARYITADYVEAFILYAQDFLNETTRRHIPDALACEGQEDEQEDDST